MPTYSGFAFTKVQNIFTGFNGSKSYLNLSLCAEPYKAKECARKEFSIIQNVNLISSKCPVPCAAIFFDGKLRTYKSGTNDAVNKFKLHYCCLGQGFTASGTNTMYANRGFSSIQKR